MSKPEVTQIADSGLRYHSKSAGSPFSGLGQIRSCFFCGRHRPPAALMTRRLLGRTEQVCKPQCGAES
ncbi:hypothetical protein OOT46_27485 [Aquabacterium sp. A7-Y]|uniref:hypothetical protein n=1 Tax=Aquabacterium sp. A7-Y TaxID=1349605 RepID=UPI00223D65BC|nr:hypothetical protein [Aquabacterium sp. A7-Y]MCW7541552.1 hypothetical protein [Aquabacterium sp. A7-Y]